MMGMFLRPALAQLLPPTVLLAGGLVRCDVLVPGMIEQMHHHGGSLQ
jgi:hypothetical protein